MCGGMLLSALLGPQAGFLSMIVIRRRARDYARVRVRARVRARHRARGGRGESSLDLGLFKEECAADKRPL